MLSEGVSSPPGPNALRRGLISPSPKNTYLFSFALCAKRCLDLQTQVPKPRCLSPKTTKQMSFALRAKRCLDLQTKPTKIAFRTPITSTWICTTMIPQQSLAKKHCLGSTRRFHIYIYIYIYISTPYGSCRPPWGRSQVVWCWGHKAQLPNYLPLTLTLPCIIYWHEC